MGRYIYNRGNPSSGGEKKKYEFLYLEWKSTLNQKSTLWLRKRLKMEAFFIFLFSELVVNKCLTPREKKLRILPGLLETYKPRSWPFKILPH